MRTGLVEKRSGIRNSTLDSTREWRPGGPVRRQDTGLRARKHLWPQTQSSGTVETQEEATNPLGTLNSPFWSLGVDKIIAFPSCCLPRSQGDQAPQLPRSPPYVLQGAGQEGGTPPLRRGHRLQRGGAGLLK